MTNELDLKAPLKIQKSIDSTVIATFPDTGPTFAGALTVTGSATVGGNLTVIG